MKVLFVCKANTGRSQMAAGLYNKLSKNGNADSAGTVADNAGETLRQRAQYRPAAQHVIDVMELEGVDISENTRDQLTPEMAELYDKVVVMAESNTIPDYLKNSSKFIYWDVEDPMGQNAELVRKTKAIIEQKVKDFIKQYELG